MTKIGITGGIGAGKSIIAQMLGVLGYPVYSADNEAKRLMSQSPAIREGLFALLGKESFTNGRLNRPFIAQSIFGNEALLGKINALVHPAVKSDFARWIATFPPSSLLFIESALIFEANLQDELDAIICVNAPLELRLKRVSKRDGVAEDDVLKRMAAQKGEESKNAGCSFVICNDERTALIPQLASILRNLPAMKYS